MDLPQHGTDRPLGTEWTSLVQILAAMITLAPEQVVLQVHTNYDGACGPYVQTLQEEDGALHIEALSNEFLDPPMGPDAINSLLEMGWEPPCDDGLPNFFRFIHSDDVRPGEVADFLVRTLRDVYLVQSTDRFECMPDELCRAVVRGDYGFKPSIYIHID